MKRYGYRPQIHPNFTDSINKYRDDMVEWLKQRRDAGEPFTPSNGNDTWNDLIEEWEAWEGL